ncbi:hypothetical protein BU14_2233s0001 [Porphyra umbilicalis]|uniref:Uncharacterized protein n=1 Tax=Porphyra umbilicalis TaxID=2786 RepID=A0A1X6NJL3_PORUM|nr:hypothetical protein BU14_2233s0001 [Porphyra umbilicalis]|eukprot:OSX68795.1 hypothetical protein BU14_2233s0001 [Porphyra umbilicalis]
MSRVTRTQQRTTGVSAEDQSKAITKRHHGTTRRSHLLLDAVSVGRVYSFLSAACLALFIHLS